MHFPPFLHIDVLHPNQRVFVTIVPRVRVGIGLSRQIRQHAGPNLVCAADTAPRIAIRLAAVRGVLRAIFAVEAVVAFAIRAVPFGRKVGEAEDGIFAQEVVNRFQRWDAGADYQKEKFGAGPGGEIISCPWDVLARNCYGIWWGELTGEVSSRTEFVQVGHFDG